MKNIDTVLFDLDGTLIDTNEIIIKSYQHAFKTHLPNIMITRDKIISFIGPTLQEVFSSYTVSPFKVKKMITTYRDYYTLHEFDYFSLYPDVIPVLDKLKQKGYNMGIVTSKFKAAAMPSFKHFGLDKYFRVFISLDDVTKPKPNEEPVLKALSSFNSVHNAIMIGDNRSDILSGRNANILTAGVAWSIKGPKHLEGVHPDYMLRSLNDLLTVLRID